jgi:hypothetical protein
MDLVHQCQNCLTNLPLNVDCFQMIFAHVFLASTQPYHFQDPCLGNQHQKL